jgi:hypothetical protein
LSPSPKSVEEQLTCNDDIHILVFWMACKKRKLILNCENIKSRRCCRINLLSFHFLKNKSSDRMFGAISIYGLKNISWYFTLFYLKWKIILVMKAFETRNRRKLLNIICHLNGGLVQIINGPIITRNIDSESGITRCSDVA